MGGPAPVPAQFARLVALVFAGGALVRDGCDWQQQNNGQFQPFEMYLSGWAGAHWRAHTSGAKHLA